MALAIDEMATFCKKKGFIYPSSEIYGGMAGFWDKGPYGVELFNNIKQSWWKFFVQDRDDVVGIDASIISHPRVWKASGHIENFGDFVLTCTKCKSKLRADHFINEKLGLNVEGKKADELNNIIKENKLVCPKCKAHFEELKNFNLLFKTYVGPEEEKASEAYLRGETAQGMFTDFKLIADTTRQKLPFGIAQAGTCFRNEISPRDFMFRSREFMIAELEFFIHPEEKACAFFGAEHRALKVRLLDSETQSKNHDTLKNTTIGHMVQEGKLDEWHGYWLAEQLMWFISIGLSMEKIKIREHTKQELSHYSSATFDIDYEYPFGSKELAGNANRGQYDLNQHMKESGENLALFDENTKAKAIPRVIEPTFGMERLFMAVLCEGYKTRKDEQGNEVVVLNLRPGLAPVKVAVFPLVNKLEDKAREIHSRIKKEFTCFFDRSGSVGRRYARQDELGTPFCITVDFDTLKDDAVTIRERDTAKQIRVPIKELKDRMSKLLKKEIEFEKAGNAV